MVSLGLNKKMLEYMEEVIDSNKQTNKTKNIYISEKQYGAWQVRLPTIPSKTFSWKTYGGRTQSFIMARNWRDKKIKEILESKKRNK